MTLSQYIASLQQLVNSHSSYGDLEVRYYDPLSNYNGVNNTSIYDLYPLATAEYFNCSCDPPMECILVNDTAGHK